MKDKGKITRRGFLCATALAAACGALTACSRATPAPLAGEALAEPEYSLEMALSPNISLLDQAKMQAQVLVPLVKTLRAELGEERANKLVTTTLYNWGRGLFLQLGASMPGSPKEKWEALSAAMMPRIGTDIDLQMLKEEPGISEFNITGCRFADFFLSLGEPELGAILMCEADNYMVEVGSPDVELTRTQTIMRGAEFCDFRYRIKMG